MKIFLLCFFLFFTETQTNQNLSQGSDLYCSIFFINSKLQKYLSQFEKKNPKIYELMMKQLEQDEDNSKRRILETDVGKNTQDNTQKQEDSETLKKKEIEQEKLEQEKQKMEKIKEVSNGTLSQGILQKQSDDYKEFDKESNTLKNKDLKESSLKNLSDQKLKQQSQFENDQQEDSDIIAQNLQLQGQTKLLLQKSKEINQSRDYAVEIECKTVGDFYEQQTIMRIECEKTDYFLIKYPDKEIESIRILDHFQKGQYKSHMIQINYTNQGIKQTLSLNQDKDTCKLIISSNYILKSLLILLTISFLN